MSDAVDGIRPARIERPASIAEAQEIVREAAARGLAIVASGSGCHLAVGGLPRRCDVLLRLDRLVSILDHQPGDMTVSVAAGCRLAALDEVLASSGQWLPLDPPFRDDTTVGGLIAANLSGPLRASQGTVRDLLLGIETISAEGTLVRGGGRVVKNVAGYDVPKLHVGALGSLGVIVAATFKLRPRPARESAVRAACESPGQANELALAWRDAAEPMWLEISLAGELEVFAGAGGGDAEVEATIRAWLRVAQERGVAARIEEDGAARRRSLAALAAPPAAATLKAATLPTRVGEAIDRMLAAAGELGARPQVAAHVANGVVRSSVSDAAHVTATVRALRSRFEREGGSLVVERALPNVKLHLREAGVDVWGDPGGGIALMRGVKAALDPQSVLSPGRLVGGI